MVVELSLQKTVGLGKSRVDFGLAGAAAKVADTEPGEDSEDRRPGHQSPEVISALDRVILEVAEHGHRQRGARPTSVSLSVKCGHNPLHARRGCRRRSDAFEDAADEVQCCCEGNPGRTSSTAGEEVVHVPEDRLL